MIQLPFGWTTNIWGIAILLFAIAFLIFLIYTAFIRPFVLKYKRRKAFRQLGELCKEMAMIFKEGTIKDITAEEAEKKVKQVETLANYLKKEE